MLCNMIRNGYIKTVGVIQYNYYKTIFYNDTSLRFDVSKNLEIYKYILRQCSILLNYVVFQLICYNISITVKIQFFESNSYVIEKCIG